MMLLAVIGTIIFMVLVVLASRRKKDLVSEEAPALDALNLTNNILEVPAIAFKENKTTNEALTFDEPQLPVTPEQKTGSEIIESKEKFIEELVSQINIPAPQPVPEITPEPVDTKVEIIQPSTEPVPVTNEVNSLAEETHSPAQMQEMEPQSTSPSNPPEVVTFVQQLANLRKRLEATLQKPSVDESVVDVSGEDVIINYNPEEFIPETSVWKEVPGNDFTAVSVEKETPEPAHATEPTPKEESQPELRLVFSYDNYSNESNRLGTKFKDKLELTEEEVGWCNAFWNFENVFTSIKGCVQETVRVYVSVINLLKKLLEENGSNLSAEETFFTGKITEELNAQVGHYYYSDKSYLSNMARGEFYLVIFKRAENKVRETYEHKRKVNDDFPRIALMPEFEHRIGQHVNKLLGLTLIEIKQPSTATEIALNEINTTRWKKYFEELKEKLNENTVLKFLKGIAKLEKLNEKNPNIENILFEASKALAKIDKVESLKLYLRYVHYDLKSEEIDNKQHNKTIQRSLFKTADQLSDFTKIVNDFIRSRDLEKATLEVSQLYIPKRKKIQLSEQLIKDVQQQDSKTASKLTEYLEDDPEEMENQSELTLALKTSASSSLVADGLTLDTFQLAAVLLFKENDLSLSKEQFDNYCKENGLMPGAFIENLNETCYGVVDDFLVEDGGEEFTINSEYFKKIIND